MKYGVAILAMSFSLVVAITAAPVDLDCPSNQFSFDTERSEPKCQRHSDCRYGEKCCNWRGTNYCLTGINMAPKPGVCPALTPPSHTNNFQNRRQDYVRCRYDSECLGNEKCCGSGHTGYNECVRPGPQILHRQCTEIGCDSAPGPECRTFKYVRPNGPGCEPECRVCADPPTTTPAPTTSCETQWLLICPSFASLQKLRNAGDYYRPGCRYVRRHVCS